MKAKRQENGTSPVGQEAEVPDAHEALRKHVPKKAAQEFIYRESHQPLLVLMSGVTPAKSDLVFGKPDQAMDVAAQILEHLLGVTKGWFRVDHPVFSEQWPQPGGEEFRLSQPCQVSQEAELAFLEGALESGNELAAEDAAKNLDGKKEPVT